MKRSIIMPTIAFILMTGCCHKELCDINNYTPDYKTELVVACSNEWLSQSTSMPQWEDHWPDSFGIDYDSLLPGLPKGIRTQVFNGDGTYQIRNLPMEGGSLTFIDNTPRSILFYNNDTERIQFKHLDQYHNAYATTRLIQRGSYTRNSRRTTTPQDNAYTMGQPDYLFGSFIENFIPKHKARNDTTFVSMTPWVYTYLIRYEFSHGLHYVALARGALSGMAQGVMLSSGTATQQEGTVLYPCTIETFGAQAIVNTFGIPGCHHQSTAHPAVKAGLNLEVRLKNGERLSFDFDISHQLQLQPQGGVIIVNNIKIPDEIGEKDNGAFDVDIDGWGEYEDVELPI